MSAEIPVRYPLAILVLGLALRLAWVLLIPVIPTSDSVAYDTFATNLWQHGVYGWTPDEPSAYWAVGTAAIAAATFAVLGDTYAGIVAVNLLASALMMALVWRLGEIYFGARDALFALIVVALWPNLIFFTSILSSELYFLALMLAGLFFWSRPTGPAWFNLLACGLIWGLACYVRPVVLLLPAAMAIASLAQGPRAAIRDTLRAGAAIGLIVLTVAPWTVRNAEVIGKPYLVSSNFGPNLWMGNNPDSTGGYMPLPPEVSGMSEVEREEYLADLAMDYIRADPLRFAGAVLLRLLQLHDRETIGVAWNEAAIAELGGGQSIAIAKLVSTGYWYLVLLAALSGVAVLLARVGLGAFFHPVFGGWAYFSLVHAVIVSGDRYHMPGSPFIALLAGVVLAWLWGFYRKDETRRA